MAGLVERGRARGARALALNVSERAVAEIGAVERVVEVAGRVLRVFETADVDRDLDEAIAAGRSAPYGRVLWPSAAAAAEAASKLALAGRRVLELGAGCGLVSLACAAQGADVLATDIDDGALAWLARAAAMQGLAVNTARFDVVADGALPAAELIVVADLLYEEHLARAVARRVNESLARGSEVLVCDPGRLSRVAFLQELKRAGVSATFIGEPVGVLHVPRAHHTDAARGGS